ncbi:M56 family metallopeptidase [Rubripirellula amarantea]|nr:M56 family metallopeptidase [Rubripirellula amarantea]
MSASLVFETIVTLCFHVAVIVALTAFLTSWVNDARQNSRMWTICFVLILSFIVAAFLLPHRRLIVVSDVLPQSTLAQLVAWQRMFVAALVIVWTAGVSVSLLSRGIRCFALSRFLVRSCQSLTVSQRQSLPLDDSELDPTTQVLVSDRIQGPFCWQLHKPTIVIPRYVLDGDSTILRHVLLHEVEHLRTNHPMQHFLQGACSTLFWFHPAIKMAAQGAEITREFVCDEHVTSSDGKYASYLRTLVSIAEQCGSVSCTEVPKGTLAFGNQKSALIKRSDRIVHLATYPAEPKRVRTVMGTAGLIVGAILVSQVWLPTNATASTRSHWSPWPTWSATTLHSFGVNARDFERFDERSDMHEWISGDR